VPQTGANPFRKDVAGVNLRVPVLGGSRRRFIYFDNAASTPPLKVVVKAVEEFMPYYASVHRGTGFKSLVSTKAYEEAHRLAGEFVGADLDRQTVIFVKNTTEALNKLANRLPLKRDSIVLCSLLEHHSNDLPWRYKAKVVHVEIDDQGRLDEEDLERKFKKYYPRVAFFAVTGASNIIGYLPPVHKYARLTHQYGARIVVDAAQLAPHRPINVKKVSDPEHIDYLTYAGHKMYAPFGTAVLIGDKETFLAGDPDQKGGGTVSLVDRKKAVWAPLPYKEEAGSPNAVGAVALAAAIKYFRKVGFRKIITHERRLAKYALKRMREIPGIRIYGDTRANLPEDRLGSIPFNMDERHHAKVAAILGYEGAIGVRSGCFCANPFMQALMKLSTTELKRIHSQIRQSYRAEVPGMVRVSFGLQNTTTEIDHLIKMLKIIAEERYRGRYVINRRTGEYRPRGFKADLHSFLPF
jgi:cysteine desulfurase/selenocysteine lyase